MKTNEPEKSFRCYLKARNTFIWITTSEERRIEHEVAREAQLSGYLPIAWDCATGATEVDSGDAVDLDGPPSLPNVVKRIRARTRKEVWILRDVHPWVRDPGIERMLKSLARDLQEGSDPKLLAAVVALTPVSDIPPALRPSTVSIEWPLPSREQIGELLDDFLKLSGKKLVGERENVVDAAAGLTTIDAESAFAYSIVATMNGKQRRDGVVDPKVVSEQKRQIIDREKVLTWFDPDPRGLNAVGGLDEFKEWALSRKMALTESARAYGLPSPRGVLLLGVTGCGKSLLAKTIPTAWNIPLLRMDFGALRSKYVGDSETNLRQALRVAEAVAPCALWIDEVEKALGSTKGREDGGVSSDALGTVLTWLQEHEKPVFVIATANDVTSLPPELFRKGRFDDVFFVDLPNDVEAVAILEATLKKFKRNPDDFDLEAVVSACHEFNGAELAELVPSGMFRAFADGERELSTDDLIAAADATTPISKSRAADIADLREWASSRTRPASTPLKKKKPRPKRSQRAALLDQ